MNHPNRIPLIVGGVIGTAALLLLLLLPKDSGKEPQLQVTEPTPGIQIQDPTVPEDSADPTDPVDPLDPTEPEVPPVTDPDGEQLPEMPTDPQAPVVGPKDPVVDSTVNKEVHTTQKEDPKVPSGTVTEVGKDKTETPPTDQGEIRNDIILQEKEENKPAKDEDIKDVIIVGNDKVSAAENKDEVVVSTTPGGADTGEGNKYAPEFKLPTGGDNPFDDDTNTEITDTPVEDIIGSGEERPGEGIHF